MSALSLSEEIERRDGVVGRHKGSCGGVVKLAEMVVGHTHATILQCRECGARTTDPGFEAEPAGWLKRLEEDRRMGKGEDW